MRIGIDIGSTTVKVVLLDDQDNTVFHTYERHMSKVREKTAEMLRLLSPRLSGQAVQVAVTGSAWTLRQASKPHACSRVSSQSS